MKIRPMGSSSGVVSGVIVRKLDRFLIAVTEYPSCHQEHERLENALEAPCPKVSLAAIIYSATVSLPTIDNRQFSLDPAMPRCRGVGQF
jgi:hypothetical protein